MNDINGVNKLSASIHVDMVDFRIEHTDKVHQFMTTRWIYKYAYMFSALTHNDMIDM